VKKSLFIAAAAIATIAMSAPASAANIILRDTTGSFAAQGARGQAALFAFQKAANYWNTVLKNDVTINLEIGFAALRPGVLGSTGSSQQDALVSDVYRQLRTTGTTALDRVAAANLFPLNPDGSLKFRTNAPIAPANNGGIVGGGAQGNVTFLDNNNSFNNNVLSANTANLKALGIAVDFNNPNTTFGCSTTFSQADGCVTFSSNFDFDFDPTDGIRDGAFDFTGIAIHEIGHALGFVSGVDTYDFVAGNAAFNRFQLDNFSIFSVFDLFRYGNAFDPATGARLLQLSANRPAFFSINGSTPYNFGVPALAEFANLSTGRFVGDGQQASHFKDNAAFLDDDGVCFISSRQIGILDPTAVPCEVLTVTSNDLAVFDAIGYNLDFNILANPGYTFDTAQVFGLSGLAGVPEPSTWAMLIAGFGLVGGAARRRRTRVKVSFA
jgi:PEP-CTERM motif